MLKVGTMNSPPPSTIVFYAIGLKSCHQKIRDQLGAAYGFKDGRRFAFKPHSRNRLSLNLAERVLPQVSFISEQLIAKMAEGSQRSFAHWDGMSSLLSMVVEYCSALF